MNREPKIHEHALLYGWLAGTYGLFCTASGCDYFTPVKVDKVQPRATQESASAE